MAHPVLRMLTAVAVSGIAAAASAQTPTLAPDLPTYDPTTASAESVAAEAAPSPETVVAEMQQYAPLTPIAESPYDGMALLGQLPACTESSGSWLRRGMWYADIDAVVMQRTWDSDGFKLIEEYDAVTDQQVGQIGAFPFRSLAVVQQHFLSESSPGYDGSGRLTLGRFLFRDTSNRDHNVEMVVFGGAEWNELLGAEAQLTTAFTGLITPENIEGGQTSAGVLTPAFDQRGLHIPQSLDGSGPTRIDFIPAYTSFDRARAMQTEYSSDFHSWEWNYNVAQRMRRDRMEMTPSGQWIRRAQPGFTWDYLAGLRYFDIGEKFNWDAQGVVLNAPAGIVADFIGQDMAQSDTNGAMRIRSSNNLFGIQLGGGLTYETDRWNFSIHSKHGFCINDARATTDLLFTDPNDPSVALNNFNRDLHENGLSYLVQGGVTARYHLRPNLSLRVGWEFMYATGLALAPNQIDFNPAKNQLHITGDAFYSGVTAGTEFYW